MKAPVAATAVALPALLSLAAPRSAAAFPAAGVVRDRVRAYRAAHEVEIVRELAGLLGVPNVASDAPNIDGNHPCIGCAGD